MGASFEGWLFINKSDLEPGTLPGARFKGTMQSFDDWGSVRWLSICYTPVGATILNRCPKLEWVMVRGTAYEKVDMRLCRWRGIGVVEAIPTHRNCASYLAQHLGRRPYVFYGIGHIGGLAQSLVGGDGIDSSTPRNKVAELLRNAGSVALSVRYVRGSRRPPIFDRWFFDQLKGATIVSVCRPALMDHVALLEAIRDGRVTRAVLDTPDKGMRDQLIATGKVVDTGHTAWLTGMTKEDYARAIYESALAIMKGVPKGVVLEKRS